MVRFLDLYKEYVKAKDITLRRLYLEAMASTLPYVEKLYIIDKEQQGILNLLDLTKTKAAESKKGR